MIPANDVEILRAGGFFGGAHVIGSDGKTVARGIVAAVDQREKFANLADAIGPGTGGILERADIEPLAVVAQKRATAFVRVSFDAMRADFVRKFIADPKGMGHGGHQSSSQKRSFKYLDAESAKTVTITACSFLGRRAATWKQPSSAAAALGLMSRPSWRATRFTSRYEFSVPTSMFSSASVSS